MPSKTQQNGRRDKNSGGLVVQQYWARVPGVADLLCHEGGQPSVPEASLYGFHDQSKSPVLTRGDERQVLSRFRGATGFGEHGPLLGRGTDRIRTLRGVVALTVAGNGVKYGISRSNGHKGRIQVSGNASSARAVAQMAKHAAEIRRLQSLMA